MDFSLSVVPSVTRYDGVQHVELPAGKRLKIETSPNGNELLDVEVPVGKKWVGTVVVRFVELDE